ncbi:tyrosine-protein phosphatase non-receptor type 22-like isoform X1 [Denticeps clupeoides]|uniref:tyrosine-protein phosphatase non-receptor type 22-like isoform X1 n=1 Tax=Denticeps clupeoides TaxID=299321 RepID=UPI0010A47FC4|nr:tyrosine-protein phosphatase non-receptor type 22-like isoform X1 [Denticeps clupeoides]
MDTQRQLLQDFLAEVAFKETAQPPSENAFEVEFSKLKKLSSKNRIDKTLPTKAAEKQENVKKNRYKDVVPFDHSRVKLSLFTSKDDTDYVNANFIKGVTGKPAYIATQGPLPNTIVDFWRMIWEYKVKVVVMACREFEMGRKKCECYWPKSRDVTLVCEQFAVHCESEQEKGDHITRLLNVTYKGCSRMLKQLHYVNWPDHGVPDSIPSILGLLQEMRSYQEHDDIPICIHCSAGCGRTGALCAIDFTWNLLKKQKIPQNFSIFELIQDMRTQRTSIVQTKEQYELVYRTIRFLFELHLEATKSTDNRKQVVQCPSSICSKDSSSNLCNPDTEAGDHRIHHVPKPLHPTEPVPHWSLLEGPPLLHPDLAASSPLCDMVQDPYFGQMSPKTTELDEMDSSNTWQFLSQHNLNNSPVKMSTDTETDVDCPSVGHSGDQPPPLPERTPESFILASDTSLPQVLQPLLPGDPPSPALSLPERTPESFEMADEALSSEWMKMESQTITHRRSKVGISAEWSGVTHTLQHETTSTKCRSKTMKVRMSLPVPTPAPSNCAAVDSITQTCSKTDESCQSSAPPLPERTPESFILVTDEAKSGQPWHRVGISSEWAGHTQPRTELDLVMNRSKSARIKTSKQVGSREQEESKAVENAGTQQDVLDKSRMGMSRAKSLKHLLTRRKLKSTPPPAPLLSPYGSTGFNFNFGTRLGRPKGPRNKPEAWV